MRHIKEFGKLNEGMTKNTMVDFEGEEFNYKGFNFIVDFQAEGRTYYEAPAREEGHGFHDIGGGVIVEDIEISINNLEVDVLDTYIEVKDPSVMGIIERYLANQDFVKDALSEAHDGEDEPDYPEE
jgi:hypothetical protein